MVFHRMRGRWLRTVAATVTIAAGLLTAAPTAALADGTVTPYTNCLWQNSDGTYTFLFGYTNTGATAVTIPVGANNFVNTGSTSWGQPTTFQPGNQASAWVLNLTAAQAQFSNGWTVNGTLARFSTFNVCATKPVSVGGSSAGYLAATGAVVAGGMLMFRAPRRRRLLTRAA